MLKLNNLYMKYHKNYVLKDIDLEVNKNDVLFIIGPSGSGKSTLLKCMNLLVKPTKYQITFNDKKIITEKDIKYLRKKMGMVFQSFNLFPHLSVLDNIILGPTKELKQDKDKCIKEAKELLTKVGLLNKANEYPDNLSGGQKQRIAIARCLAMKPDLILFDEPTSALDPEMTEEVLEIIKDLAKENVTMVIVSHEIELAKEIATNIIFVDKGKIVERGTPDQIFNHPKEDRLKEFISNIN
ncbi:MAG: amino acid ABC transporter ATP-binding protein [Bacilli bacterium]